MEWKDQIYDCKARTNGISVSNGAVCMEDVVFTIPEQLNPLVYVLYVLRRNTFRINNG